MKDSKQEKREKIKDPVMRAVLRLAIKVTGVILLFVLVFTFIFGVFRVNDTGMVPNIAPGDLIIYYRLDKQCVVGDVVVCSYEDKKMTARVVALPGDTVDINEDGLKINSSLQYEPKIYKETMAFEEGVEFPIVLGTDEYFVLGDNRDRTTDSRLFGPVAKSDLYGKVFTLIRKRNI